ncbi:MAG TPA: MFS transporter [Xanthobacteraceae bacterium]|nr:MFS transporter [Xanthobacteraceae bacterium]
MTVQFDILPGRADEASVHYAGWRVTFACFVLAIFCWGFGFYGHGIYLSELARLNGWPASLISGATTVYYLFSALLVVFVNDAIRRLGLRTFVLFGIGCFGASITLIGMIRTPWQLLAVYLVMSFGWAAMSVGAITNILGLWFDRRRGFAISLALTGASAGGVLIIPALTALIHARGFAAAMIIAGIVMLAILIPVTLAWIREPHERPIAHRAPGGETTSWTRPMAMRSFRFWTVTAPFALALLAQVGFLVHQIAFLEPAIGRSQAAAAVALTVAMSILGRLALGTVIDRLNQRAASAVSLASQAAALLLMTQTKEPAALFMACAVFGFSIGNLITFPALIIQREFDARAFGMLIALSTAIGQFTYALGPGLLGIIRDMTGGYAAALALCALLDLAAAAIVLLHRPITQEP